VNEVDLRGVVDDSATWEALVLSRHSAAVARVAALERHCGTHLGAWFTVHGGAYALRPFAPRLAGYPRPPEEPRCE
jgi:hypothetical protein